MPEYEILRTATFSQSGIEYKAWHMEEWATAPPGLLTVHAGDRLRGDEAELSTLIQQGAARLTE